jgi:crotonobetainyl-CoA:carnitine CoA-transferase CaiB-like acyl-CoA transferase
MGAFWSRGGIAVLLAHAGQEPVGSRGGFGDHITASHCLAGIVTALYAREKTGRGQLVDACLLRSGIYTVGFDVAQQLAFGAVAPLIKREDAIRPTVSSYRAGDGRWVWLLGVEGDRHWPRLCEGLERPELKDDPRFASAAKRRENARELIRILDEQFARRPLAEWLERFDAVDLWWSPVNTRPGVAKDAGARRAPSSTCRMVAGNKKGVSEAQYRFSPSDTRTPRCPVGEARTEAVLREFGGAARIPKLRERPSFRDRAPPPRHFPRSPRTNISTGGAYGELRMLRCRRGGTWIHPPAPTSGLPRGTGSGGASSERVATYTVNHQPWIPGFRHRT